MAQLLAAFDARSIDPSQGTPSLPVGKHPVVIVNSEIKSTSNNDGGLLELTVQITDGPAKGQTGAYRLNLYNKSAKAAEIAHKQLSGICHVIGVYQLTDSTQLHNIPFVMEVGFQKGHAPGEPDAKGYTEVKRVFDINGNEPGKQGQPAAPAQPMQQQAAAPQQQAPAQAAWGAPAAAPAQQPAAAPAAAPWGGAAPAAAQGAPAGGAPWGR